MSKSKEEFNVHAGHRERLRKKLFEVDGDVLEDHELLELLLFYSYRRKNTNEIAHRLLNKFGSLYNVLVADKNELMTVEDVGEQTAAFILLQGQLLRTYNIQFMNSDEGLKLTPRNAGRYIVNFFRGYAREKLFLFALDAECNVITAIPVSRGSFDKVHADVREIVKIAMDTKSTYIILAHNHPNKTLVASKNDIILTMELEKALSFVNIRMLDHIIVAGEEYVSLANQFRIFGKKE